MRVLLALVLLGGLTACRSFKTVDLAPEWRPLERVAQAGDKLLKPGQTTCLGTTLCVADLDDWSRLYPEGSIKRRALLLHERVHSQRQIEAGLAPWLARYVADADFRWREERLGWEQEIATLTRAGVQVPVEVFAKILSDEYVHFGARMVSATDARAWILEVISLARKTP